MAYQYRAKILKVLDGDTVEIDLDLGFNIMLANQKVRLAGIDTPESDRKSTRLNSSHIPLSRMPSSA